METNKIYIARLINFILLCITRISEGSHENGTSSFVSSSTSYIHEVSLFPSSNIMLSSFDISASSIKQETATGGEFMFSTNLNNSPSQHFTLNPSFTASSSVFVENENTIGTLHPGEASKETPILTEPIVPTIVTSTSNSDNITVFSIFFSNLQMATDFENITTSQSPTMGIFDDSTSAGVKLQLDQSTFSTSIALDIEMSSVLYTSSHSYPTTLAVTSVPKVKPRQSRYFLIIKSDDCPRLKVHNINHQLSKALSTLGVLNVSADIAKARCQTQLNVNITATAPYSAIRLLEDSKRRNMSVRVFNRTFKIVDIQNLSGYDGDENIPTTPTISAISKTEFSAYVAVGSCFGLVLVICSIVCCIKCWTVNTSNSTKRNKVLRSNPMTPEDYTLTPIPRPSSLYVDYYRNSISADVYSTTSAGSGNSISPTVDKGVVRAFDTSIVPLEDTVLSNFPEGVRRSSVESANGIPWKPQMLTNHGLMYCNAITDSRERLHPRHSNLGLIKAVGISNPTYQRY